MFAVDLRLLKMDPELKPALSLQKRDRHSLGRCIRVKVQKARNLPKD